MKIHLYDKFDYKKLLKFTLPSIVMMIFTSIYSVIDGLFISNFVGTTPFAAVNLIYPYIMILGSFGFMFGAGGSALVSKLLGEGNAKKANAVFSLLVYVTVALGAVLAVVGVFVLRPIARLLGAEGEMLELCVEYGRILLFAVPAFMLQFEFQSFFVTAEKPHFGLAVTVSSGVANIILDSTLVAGFKLGVSGAAWATFASQIVGGALPLVYFFRKNGSLLHLGKASLDMRALVKACLNGSSELLTNISASLVSMLYNFQLMKYAGENGVAAYGVMMYVTFIFQAAFIGYAVGSAPIVGYNYGAKNNAELRNAQAQSCDNRRVFRGDARACGGACRAAVIAVLPPRCGGIRVDPARFQDIRRIVFVCGHGHIRLVVLYRAQQRARFRRHLSAAHARLSDRGGFRAAAIVADRRHLGEHCRRGSAVVYRIRVALVRTAQ